MVNNGRIYLVGGLEHGWIMTFHWEEESQVTNSYSSEGLNETTNQIYLLVSRHFLMQIAVIFVCGISMYFSCFDVTKKWASKPIASHGLGEYSDHPRHSHTF